MYKYTYVYKIALNSISVWNKRKIHKKHFLFTYVKVNDKKLYASQKILE